MSTIIVSVHCMSDTGVSDSRLASQFRFPLFTCDLLPAPTPSLYPSPVLTPTPYSYPSRSADP